MLFVEENYVPGDLNTSHVKLQHANSWLATRYGLYLNTSHVKLQPEPEYEEDDEEELFKYISC